jgi:predicted dinucleotide-binding enzyme
MKISVLGTGMVGQAIAGKLTEKHDVMVGSRDRNNPKAKEWIKKLSKISLGTFEESAQFGEIIFNCTQGSGTLSALALAGEKALGSKIIIDTSNPLDFSPSHELSLFVCNTDSLAEQIQRTYPNTKVIKTLNTLTAQLMVNPSLLQGKHNLFIAGNNGAAKTTVRSFLHESFGWTDDAFIDLGDITGARSAEMFVMLWVKLWNHFQNPMFNVSVLT